MASTFVDPDAPKGASGFVDPDTPKTYSAKDIPGVKEVTPQKAPTAGEAIVGAGEAALTTATGAVAGPLAAGAGMASIPFGGDKEEVAGKVMESMTYQPRTESGKSQAEAVGKFIEESGLMALMPGMAVEVPGIGAAIKGIKGKVISPKAPAKFVDPDFAKSKIKPNESVSDVIQRKQDTQTATTKLEKQNEDLAKQSDAKLDMLNNPPKDYHPKDAIEAKHWAEQQLKATDHNVDGYDDARASLRIMRDKADEMIEADQHPSIREDHGITSTRSGNYIDVVDIPEDLQKQGLGTKIVQNMESDIQRQGHKTAFLLAKPESIGFWEKQGYAKDPSYVEETGENVPMHKVLDKNQPKEQIAHEIIDNSITAEEKESPSIKSAVEIIKDASRNLRADIRKADIWGKTIEKTIPDEKERTAITRSMDVGKKHKNPLVEKIQDRFKAIGEQAKAAGLIDGLRENYVTHILDFSKSKLSEEAQQSLFDKIVNQPKDSKLVKDFTETRVYETLRELEEAVKDTGVVVHTDIAKIAVAYEKAMQTAIIHKNMIERFEKTLATTDGKPLIVPVSSMALKDGYKAFQGKGSRSLEGKLVHPDSVDAMGFMFRQTDPSLILRSLGGISHLTKALNTVGSLFHAYTLGTAHAVVSPTSFAKEVFSGGKGIRQAVEAFRNDENHELIDGFIRDGLMAGTEDIKRTILADTGIAVDKALSKFGPEITLVQHATTPFDKHVLQRLNSFTWDYMHTGQKLHLAMRLFGEAKAKNPHIADEVLRKEISSFVNNTFGGLDWLEVASQTQNKVLNNIAMKAANIQGREWAQILFFAPDWMVSTLRAFTTALPKEISKPQNWKLREGVKGIYNPTTQGDFARRYVLHTAIAYLTILNGLNIALSGHPIWENKDPTRIDKGDGTSMQVAKHAMEAFEWFRDLEKTLGNKLGFWPRAVSIITTGVASPSPSAPKIKDNTAIGRAKAVLLLALPFQVGAAVQAPKGEELKRAVMSTLGIPEYGRQTDKFLGEAARNSKRHERIKQRLEKQREVTRKRNAQ